MAFRNSSSPLPLRRRDRNIVGEFEDLLVLLDERQQLGLLLHQVDLVQHQEHRRFGPARDVDGVPVLLAEGPRRVGHEQQQVALFQRFAHRVHQPLVQRRIGLVDARRIEKDDLRLGRGDDALDRSARGLRLIRHDRDLLAHQGIEKGRCSCRTLLYHGDGDVYVDSSTHNENL